MEFDKKCNEIGSKYKEYFDNICTDESYNKTKLLNENVTKEKYYQFSSELLLYYFLKNKFENIKHDVKINSINDTDVDIVCSGTKQYSLNIEIKTPLEEEHKEGNIVAYLDHRYGSNINEVQEVKKDTSNFVNDLFAKMKLVDSNINTTYNQVKDSPLKNSFDHSIDKFPFPKNDSINVLIICLDSTNLCNYIDFVLNNDSGMYTNNFILDLSKYQNIEYLVINNCCEAHKKIYKFNNWNFSNYLSFVFPVHKNNINNEKLSFLNDIFNSKTCDFMNYYFYSGKIEELNTSFLLIALAYVYDMYGSKLD